VFITGGKPADFKSKKNMTTVRKKAMDAFLKSDKSTVNKPRRSVSRSRLDSEESASNQSISSIGSHDALIEFSTAPTTYSHSRRSASRTKTSALRRSSFASASHDQDVSSTSSIALHQKGRDLILSVAPIVQPSRTNIKLPYDDYTPPPFVSLGKSRRCSNPAIPRSRWKN
jgi:hypothetical protein